MYKLALIATFVAIVLSFSVIDRNLDHSWELWKHEYSRNYSTTAEEMFRRRVWEDTYQFVTKHNEEYSRGLHSFTVGMNQFSDMTLEEFPGTGCLLEGSDYDTYYDSDYDDVQNEQKSQNISGLQGYVTNVENQTHEEIAAVMLSYSYSDSDYDDVQNEQKSQNISGLHGYVTNVENQEFMTETVIPNDQTRQFSSLAMTQTPMDPSTG